MADIIIVGSFKRGKGTVSAMTVVGQRFMERTWELTERGHNKYLITIDYDVIDDVAKQVRDAGLDVDVL